MCRQRKKTHPPRESQNIKKIKSLHFSSASPVLQHPWSILPTNRFIGPHRGAGLEILKPVKARFWSKIQKTRDHPEPSISVLKNRIFTWDPGRSWGPPHLGCFWRQTFPLKGGRSLRQGGVSEDYFAFKIEKYDPPLTKIRL